LPFTLSEFEENHRKLPYGLTLLLPDLNKKLYLVDEF